VTQTIAPGTCTLDGWLPEPGSYVWQQMYSPQIPAPDSTIYQRIQKGQTYGPRRLMRVLRIVPNDPQHSGLDRYYLIAADHKYTERTIARLMENLGALGDWPDGMSATESDWAVLWPADAQAEMGVLF
jgi:hypothetical protein